jgi:predicted ATP-grasp superfamily ATP-dependent carboligase
VAGGSRHCTAEVRVPDPLGKPDDFVSAVEAFVGANEIDVLIPIAEPSLLAILPQRQRFSTTKIPFAPYEQFLRICDKAAVADAAAEIGIGVPRQVVANTPGEALRLAGELRFPVVLKPSRSVVGNGDGQLKLSVVHVDRSESLEGALLLLPDAAYPLLVQERIIGPGVGVFLLVQQGNLSASFAHRRLREKPPAGGVSVYRESVALDPQLREQSFELLKRFGWEGVAMVEYKLNETTGTPYIMEINGRFWGSLQLAIDAGVDFPKLLLSDPAGEVPATEYTIGVRSLWEWGAVDHLVARYLHTSEELSLPAGSPGRLRATLDFLAALGPASRKEVLRMSDLRPFIRESSDWLRRR